jgi:hypothetical protein
LWIPLGLKTLTQLGAHFSRGSHSHRGCLERKDHEEGNDGDKPAEL